MTRYQTAGAASTPSHPISAAGLINSIRLASRLMENQGSEIPYKLRAKLGSNSRWLPATTITETGTIPLR